MNPKAKTSHLVVQDIEDCLLIYNRATSKGHYLDKFAASVWHLCDGSKSPATISEIVSKNQVERATELEIAKVIEEFTQLGLLEQTQTGTAVEKLARREFMQKLATGAAALPFVTTLAVPGPANAASAVCGAPPLPDCCPCTSNGSCDSGCCAPAPDGCVPANSLGNGTPCRANCNCVTGCCGLDGMGGEICVPVGLVPSGGDCQVNCECASGTCLTVMGGTDVCA